MYNILIQRSLKYSLKNILKLLNKVNLFQIVEGRNIYYKIDVKPHYETYYFAYGANLNTARFDRFHIPHQFLGKAKLPGYMLNFSLSCEFKSKGYASVEKSEKENVWGCLYKTTKFGLLMLDILEWVPFNFYERHLFQVKSEDTEGVEKSYLAWAYIAKHPQPDLMPSKGYLDLIKSESIKNNFPESYIKFLNQQKFSENFDIDHGFRLSNPGKRRFFEDKLKNFYLAHDKLRDFLTRIIP